MREFTVAIPVAIGSPGRLDGRSVHRDLVAELEDRLAATAREIEEIRADIGHLLDLSGGGGAGGPEAPVEARLLTVAQAAAALALGESTDHGLIRSGRLGSRKISGARRVPVADLNAFVSELPSGSLEMGKRAYGEGSLYRTPDGYRHASINLGSGLDSRLVRWYAQARTQREVKKRLDDLKKDRDDGVDLAAAS